jgi:hypothetical protein
MLLCYARYHALRHVYAAVMLSIMLCDVYAAMFGIMLCDMCMLGTCVC